ncbi:DUF6923 family protein, partial [Tahibacter aquaticus]|uniref:DUF6923 family protein n=1 Tax=Tahibacter aquaticus TaxID=520092 RepID=UPI0014150EDE
MSIPAAQAQIQRNFLDASFEIPNAGPTSVCAAIIGSDAFPGWNTSHPPASATMSAFYCPPGITAATPGVNSGGLMELWTNAPNGVPALGGTQLAELNAYVPSRLSQSLCLLNGETASFTLGHRGRENPTIPDIAEFNIDSAANSVLRASTTSTAVGGVVQCGNTTMAATNGPIVGANDGSVLTPTCSSSVGPSGWRRYTGTFVWNGTSGTHNFGFESISAASGPASGNLFDEVNVTLPPVIEFAAASYSSREGQPITQPQLIVVGNVPTGGIPVTVAVLGGTATATADFTTTTFTIPAGTYDTPTTISMTGLISVVDDSVIENNETVQLQIQPAPGYLINSTSVCDAGGTPDTTFTILDNDVDVLTTKTVSNANPAPGGTTTFTVTYQNNTARPTVGANLTIHDVNATLADALPAGFTAFNWTCAAGGTPAPICPAASGTGAIAVPTVTLFAGNGAAGGTLTYTITGTVAPARCAATTNTSTIAVVASQVAEGTAAQAGFTTPVPGGTANNSASVAVDPGCLTLSKTTLGGVGGPFTFTLANTAQTTGTATTTVAGTPVQVDGNAAAGVQPYGVSAAGSAITINEAALPAGYGLATASCSDGTGTVGSRSGTTYTIPAASVTGGTDFTCSFTNSRPSIRLSKLLSAGGRIAPADQFTLTIAGPSNGTATTQTTTTTGTGNTVGAGTASFLAADSGATYTLSEAMAAGSANTLGAYTGTINCTNANAGSTTVLPAAGSTYNPASPITVVPTGADDITCTITNAISTLPTFAAPGVCTDTPYLSQFSGGPPTTLFEVGTTTNPFTYNPLGTAVGALYNAIGYRAADGYIYAVESSAPGGLVRVGSNGQVQNLGVIAGLPASGVNSGDVGSDGFFYVKPGNATSVIYRINVTALTATAINLHLAATPATPFGFAVSDISWTNGLLYGHGTTTSSPTAQFGQLYAINPANGDVTLIGTPHPVPGSTAGFGAMIGATNGVFGVINDAPGGFYQFNTTTGIPTLLSAAPPSSGNDGAKCVSSNLVLGADLAVTKTNNQTVYTPGQVVSYTIVVSNNGPFGAQGAVVNDPLPAGVAAGSVSWTCGSPTNGGQCGAASGAAVGGNAINNQLVDLPVGASVAYTLQLTIPAGQVGNFANTVTVTAPITVSDPTPANNSATDTDLPQPQLALAKTWSNAVLTDTASLTATGGTGSPTLASVVNATNETDTGTSVRMQVGNVVTLNETLGAGNSGLYDASSWSCTGGTLSGNQLTLGAGTAGTSIVCTITNTRRQVNLTVTKTATPTGSYLPGQPLNYSIVVTNNGPGAASSIAVSDTVPASVTVASWACTASGGTADCDTVAAGTGAAGTTNAISLPNVRLGVGESLTIAVTGAAQLGATGAIVNTATATPPAGATCTTPPCGVSSTTTNTNGGTPQLTLTKSASPASFAVGQAATYTLQVGNTGTTSTAGAITISDPLPLGITTTALPSGTGWDCSASTSTTVSCTTAQVLLPGSNAPPITVPVTIGIGTATPAVNTATTSGGGDASCPVAAHCQSTTTTAINAPRLDVSKVLQGNFVVGVPSNYLITVTNTGQADTLAGTITDTIPAGLTLGTLPAGCTAVGQNLTCTIPAGISAGTGISFTIPVTPQASTSGQSLSNSATAHDGGDPSCPAAAHCTGTTTNTVDAPQLQLVKTASPTTFVVGVPATYTLQVTNIGTAATTAATTVSDPIPGGLTLGTLPAGCSAVGQVVTCTIAAGLATGTPVSFVIPVTATPALNGLSVTNNATATGGGDPSCPTGGSSLPANCTGTTTTAINAPQLTIVKSASAANFVVGVPASYTLQVTNTGTAATTATATVSDTIPADLIIGTLPAGCSAAGQVVTCTIATGFATGTPVSFVIAVTPTGAASGQTLTNTATVSGGGDPTCPGGAPCSSTTNTPVNAPQLTIQKTASGSNFVVGVPASYTLQVTNTGTAATTVAATVSDTIPGTLTIGTPLPADCSAAGQVVTCTIAAGFATGTPVSFVIPVTPTAAASGTTVSNTATVSGGGDPACPAASHCTSTTTTPVNAPQLTIVKSASGANFVVGVPASYTLQVTNTGSAATTAPATVGDAIPGTLTIGSLPAGCTATGQNVSCTIPAGLAVGTPVSFVIPVTPTAAASGTTVSNTATVSGGGDPTCPGGTNCTSTTNTPVDAPQLSVSKSASGSNFVVGVPASYTLQVSNTGTAATTAVATVSDTVPAGLTLGTLPAGCTASGQTVSCSVAAGLGVGASTSFIIPVTPSAATSGTTVSNTATVSGGGDPTCPADTTHCSSTVDVPVNAPRLTMTKTASAASFVVGIPASYTLQVTNTGSAATTAAATISDTIPASLTPGAAPAGCTITGQNVSCTIAAGLAVSASTSFTIPVTPTASASGTTVSNTATVSGGGDPTCPADTTHCSSTVDVPVNAPRLTMTKTASAASFVVGVPASYTLQVTNTGSAATTAAATISDTIPASLAPGAAPAGCTITGQNVSCTIAAGLAVGASASFVIPVTPTAAASGTTVSNTATVSGGGDPTCPADTTHCSSTVDVPVDQIVNLTIAKTATPSGTYVPGQALNYSIVVTNTGSSPASGISVSDTVPASVLVASWTCTASGTTADCDTAAAGTGASGTTNAIGLTAVSLGVGESLTIAVTGTAQLSATGAIVNTATASPPAGAICTTPPCSVTDTTTNTDGGAPQLTLTKTATPGAFAVGQPATYSLQVGNTGTSSTVGTITISDPLPAGITTTATPSGTGWDCSASTTTQVNCTTSTVLLPGSNAPVISVPVTIGVGTASPAVNTATASGGGDASCPADTTHCTSTTTTPVNAPRLDVTKVLQGNFVVGVQSSYLITVTNNGQADTLAGTITDTIPTGLTLGILPAGCTVAGQLVTCNIPAGLSTGTSLSFAIPVTPTPALIGQSVTNTATAHDGGDPTCPAELHCTGTTTDTVQAPQLQIVKSATPATFVVGVAASYTLTVTNTGTAATTAIATVSDTLPAGLSIGAVPAGCTVTGQVVSCTIAAGLATGTPVSFTIPVTPTAALSGLSVTNNASVRDGGDPSCATGAPTPPARCTSSVTVPVDAPQLTIVKTASAANFVVGVPASYTLTVTNTGSAATTAAATVSDTIPASLTLGTAPAGCTLTGQSLSCSIPAGLAVGASASFILPVTATAAASGTTVVNTATVSGGGDPTCPGGTNCSSTVNVPVDAPQLTIVKTASAANFVVGVPASYTLTVTNTGSAATTAVASVSDTIPASLTPGTAPAGCTLTGQSLSCSIPAGLAVGASASFILPVTATAAASGTTVVNTATVSGGGDPTCPGGTNCSSTVNVPVDAPQLTIVKTASAANFVVGVPASYTLTVTNTGSAATTAVASVSDTIPASLTPGTAPAGCTLTGQSLSCSIPAGLAVG